MDLSELVSMLKNAECAKDIDRKREEIGELVPAVKVMFDYDQQNYMHRFDLWMHSLHTAVNLPRNLEDDMLYLAALFHDIGKPESRCRSKRPEDRNTHYYGHPKKSVEIIDTIIIPDLDRKGYKIPCLDVKRLFYYVRHHDDNISVREARVRRYMEGVSFEEFQNLMLRRWQMQGTWCCIGGSGTYRDLQYDGRKRRRADLSKLFRRKNG